MKQIALLIFSLLGTLPLVKVQDTLYFDTKWKKSTKDNHAFYRPLPLKKKSDLVYIQDYYKNGNLQMQGYALAKNEDAYVGDIYFYDENGYDNGFRQYENKSTTTELTYYQLDGSIWQKITYNTDGKKQNIKTFLNGKLLAEASIDTEQIITGTIGTEIPKRYYDENEEHEKIQQQLTEVSPVTGPPSINQPVRKEKSFVTNIFWQNGQIAATKKLVYSQYSGVNVKEQSYYDMNGKLLSTKQENSDTDYKTYKYYTKNYFAIGITEENSYSKNQLNGDQTTYDTAGKTTLKKKYAANELVQEEEYSSGNKTNTTSYKNEQPYHGSFKIKENNTIQKFTLKDGVKIGEEITIDQKDSSIVAKGNYKDGTPWSGTFLKNDDDREYQIASYKYGKLHGIQTFYNNRFRNDIIEQYEMKNGLRDGFRKLYKNEELIAESIYQQDRVLSGTIINDDTTSMYNNGKLILQKISTDKSYNFVNEELHYDTNGSVSKIVYRDFQIIEKPQSTYEGIFKNEKPWQGYFRRDTLIDNIRLIDFYESGKLKFKYYFDLLEHLENESDRYIYTQKATYKDGKIIDGKSFKQLDRSGLLEVFYQNSRATKIDLNLFAMHAFERLTAKLDGDKIIVSQLGSPFHLEIVKEKDAFIASFFKNEQLVQKPVTQTVVKEGSPNSLTHYYLEDKKVKKLTRIIQPSVDDPELNNSILYQVYHIFPLENKKDITNFFTYIAQGFQQAEEFNSTFLDNLTDLSPFPSTAYLSMVQYDSHGKIPYGIRITQKENDSILLEGYSDNILKQTVTVKNITELLKNENEVISKMSHKLLNE